MSGSIDAEILDSPQTQPGGNGRIAALDGLRAIAVLAVILFHTSSAPLAGGYLGVDVFFVLSGFLIAGILVDQFGRDARIGLTDFWLRRARRLAPALLVLLLVIAMARLAVPQAEPGLWRGQILAALTYTTNWFQIATGADYFNQFGEQSPLLHTWSLAIEEQFYLGFAVLLVMVVPRLRLRGLLWLFSVLALLSAGWMFWQADRNPVWAYYSTGTRVQALLVGAGLAVLVRHSTKWWTAPGSRRRAVVGWTSAGGLAVAMVFPGSTTSMLRGGFLVVAFLTAGLIWGLLVPGGLSRLFAWRPLAALGTISYGVYLWHWPVFLWLQPQGEATLAREAWAAGVSVILAAASYVLVERPIRQGRFTRTRPRTQWLSYAVAAAVIAGLALLPARTLPADQALRWPPSGDIPKRIMVAGDSTMFALGSRFPSTRYPETTVGGPTAIGCGLVTVPYMHEGSPVSASQCDDWQRTWQQELTQRQPQVVVVGSPVWDSFDRAVQGLTRPPGTPEFDQAYTAAFRDAAIVAGDQGRVPVYVLGIPCMAARIDQVVLNDPTRIAYLNGLVRSAVQDLPNTHFVDLAPLTCAADGTAVVVRDGRVLRDDGVHWTSAGAEEVWSMLLQRMVADGAASTSATPGISP